MEQREEKATSPGTKYLRPTASTCYTKKAYPSYFFTASEPTPLGFSSAKRSQNDSGIASEGDYSGATAGSVGRAEAAAAAAGGPGPRAGEALRSLRIRQWEEGNVSESLVGLANR